MSYTVRGAARMTVSHASLNIAQSSPGQSGLVVDGIDQLHVGDRVREVRRVRRALADAGHELAQLVRIGALAGDAQAPRLAVAPDGQAMPDVRQVGVDHV